MATTSESLAFDRGVRPVMEIVLPEKADAVTSFRADAELQARIEELAQKSTDGELTEDERAEYAGYVRANKIRRDSEASGAASHQLAVLDDRIEDQNPRSRARQKRLRVLSATSG